MGKLIIYFLTSPGTLKERTRKSPGAVRYVLINHFGERSDILKSHAHITRDYCTHDFLCSSRVLAYRTGLYSYLTVPTHENYNDFSRFRISQHAAASAFSFCAPKAAESTTSSPPNSQELQRSVSVQQARGSWITVVLDLVLVHVNVLLFLLLLHFFLFSFSSSFCCCCCCCLLLLLLVVVVVVVWKNGMVYLLPSWKKRQCLVEASLATPYLDLFRMVYDSPKLNSQPQVRDLRSAFFCIYIHAKWAVHVDDPYDPWVRVMHPWSSWCGDDERPATRQLYWCELLGHRPWRLTYLLVM